MKELYKILEVNENANIEEITTSWKRLSKKYHPDKKDGDVEKMKEINQAYAVLKNPEKKEHYDKTGDTNQNQKYDRIIAEAFKILLEIVKSNPPDIEKKLSELKSSTIQQKIITIKKTEKEIERFTTFKDRIIKKPENTILLDMLENEIDKQKQRIYFFEEEYEQQIKAIEMVQEYGFEIFESDFSIRQEHFIGRGFFDSYSYGPEI